MYEMTITYSRDNFGYTRKPEVTKYTNKKEAEMFQSVCLHWGIGIASCTIKEIKE